VEGIAASLAEALDRMPQDRQPEIQKSLECGRRDAADGHLKQALGALADGFALYRAGLEQSRRDTEREQSFETPFRDELPNEPSHDPATPEDPTA
jgi:hypothetical protein